MIKIEKYVQGKGGSCLRSLCLVTPINIGIAHTMKHSTKFKQEVQK